MLKMVKISYSGKTARNKSNDNKIKIEKIIPFDF